MLNDLHSPLHEYICFCLLHFARTVASFMASPHIPNRAKRLRDMLRENQEPFLLDSYLQEKGYSMKIPESKCNTKSWARMLKKKLQNSGDDIRKRKAMSLVCRRILRKVFIKVGAFRGRKNVCDLSITSGQEFFTVDIKDTSMKTKAEIAQDHIQSQPDYVLSPIKLHARPDEVARGDIQWGCREDLEQPSPVSVLELSSDEAPPINSQEQFHWQGEKEQELPEKKGGEAILQTQRLLIDCVREIIEKKERDLRDLRDWRLWRFRATEELQKIIYEHIYSWSKQRADITNITQLIESDIHRLSPEFSHFPLQIRRMGRDIEDAIFEEICREFISDMYHSSS